MEASALPPSPFIKYPRKRGVDPVPSYSWCYFQIPITEKDVEISGICTAEGSYINLDVVVCLYCYFLI